MMQKRKKKWYKMGSKNWLIFESKKWDAKVVEKMDAIFDANMVLLRMQIWH